MNENLKRCGYGEDKEQIATDLIKYKRAALFKRKSKVFCKKEFY